MLRSAVSAILIAIASSVVFGQTAPDAPAFEVASVKPSTKGTSVGPGGGVMIQRRLGGDPGRVDYTNVTLKIVIARAYGVKDFQISGPEWLDSEGYDIVAKVPEGVPTSMVPAMLQRLLAERFHLAAHKETKTLPVYALTVAKGGPKLKEIDPAIVASYNTDSAGRGGQEGAPPPPPPPDAPRIGMRGGVPVVASPGRPGGIAVAMGPAGITLRGQITLAALTNSLSNFMDHPVLDQTGLTGTYDIELIWMPDESSRVGGRGMMGGPPPGAGGAAGGGGEDHMQRSEASQPVGNVFQALQQLGLKLEASHSPVETIVVDKADKVPTEN
ncbi:MAG TPA: TIGR03435 family protein [Bryobacteraceae bacterium]|nr:TIGR03435 family protein [Bryobacteraceae bacterium]